MKAEAAREPAGEMPSDAEMATERERYLDEARSFAAKLEARWTREPPAFNATTGDGDLDSLVWFRYLRARGV
jgi:hypothetical protein